MSDKNNIRRVIVTAVFVLLLFIAVFIVLSVSGGQDGTSSDTTSSSAVTSTVEDTKSSATESSSTKESTSSEKQSTQSSTDKSLEESKPQSTQSVQSEQSAPQTVTLRFRNKNLLNQHYEKHGKDMGFSSAAEYEKAAAAVPVNPAALHKIEKEDGDDVYYIEATNEFVVVSTDGFIRTYFLPDSGRKYFDKQ